MVSVDSLTGRSDCTEAVMAQQRASWVPGVSVVVVLAGCVLAASLDAPPLVWVFAGALGGVCFATLTTYWIVARCGDRVVLARSRSSWARAVEIVWEHDTPLRVVVIPKVLTSSVYLADRKLHLARQFRSRFDRIVA